MCSNDCPIVVLPCLRVRRVFDGSTGLLVCILRRCLLKLLSLDSRWADLGRDGPSTGRVERSVLVGLLCCWLAIS